MKERAPGGVGGLAPSLSFAGGLLLDANPPEGARSKSLNNSSPVPSAQGVGRKARSAQIFQIDNHQLFSSLGVKPYKSETNQFRPEH